MSPDILLVYANFHLAVCVPRIGFTSSFRRYHELASFSWSKTFAHEPVISQGSRGISFVLPPVMGGQEREPCHRSQCRFALPLLTVRSEKRKDVSYLSHRPKRGSFVKDVMTRVGWRSRNPSRARCHMGKPSRIQQKRRVLNDATVFHYGVHLLRAISRITSLITFKINVLGTDDKANEHRGTVTVQLSYSCWAVGI